MSLFGSIRITDHVMWRIVQQVNLFVAGSCAAIFNADFTGIVIIINGGINHASVFIVVDAVLNQI